MSHLVPPVSSVMRTTSLSSPAGALMRPTLRIEAVDSLALAAARFRQNGAAVLPVVENDLLAGVITDQALARALAAGVEPTDAVRDWMTEPDTIFNYESGAEALRRVEEERTLVVIDETRRVLGLISAADLWPRKRPQPRPPVVGGMATPFGVYLTTGSVSGGVPKWALVGTGAAMALMMVAAYFLLWPIAPYIERSLGPSQQEVVLHCLAIGVFLVIMRLIPLSGTHGAEHQVVHAIERDEDLVPEVVRRMPRVHPRCGTNLAVGAAIFSAVLFSDWTSAKELRLIAAAIATFVFWRPVGGFFQQYLTTKRPSDKQLAGGIEAGKMLLENFATAKSTFPSPWQRVWNSGIFQVLTGAMGMVLLLYLVGLLFHVDLLPLVS